LGGGLEQGSSTVLIGPAGSGKSLQFVSEAIRQGGGSSSTRRSGGCSTAPGPLGFDLVAMRASGKLIISQQAAAELSPGEFAHRVRRRIQQSRPL
jgi:circadian clock protein KaiC